MANSRLPPSLMLWLFDKMLTCIPASLNSVLIQQFGISHFSVWLSNNARRSSMVSSPIVVHSAKRLMSFKLIPVFFKHCNKLNHCKSLSVKRRLPCALIRACKMSFYQHNYARFYRNLSMCTSTKATIIAITSSPVLLVSILPIMRHF